MTLNFCIVGLGKHSQNKLIPSIMKSKNRLKYIVSSKKKINYPNLTIFNSINDAIQNVENETIFILCSPPKIHEKQALILLKNNFNLIIEKPSFVTFSLLKNSFIQKKNNNKFIFENFMYKYSFGYYLVNSIIKNFFSDITLIKINFLIPSYPKSSFRKNTNYSISTIYDIGCYITSFLIYNKIAVNDIFLKKHFTKGQIDISSIFSFNSNSFNIEAHIGRNNNYNNQISIYLKNNFKIIIKYFFYGSDKNKILTFFHNGKLIHKITFFDENQFDFIFNQPKSFYFKNQITYNKSYEQLLMLKKMEILYNKNLTN